MRATTTEACSESPCFAMRSRSLRQPCAASGESPQAAKKTRHGQKREKTTPSKWVGVTPSQRPRPPALAQPSGHTHSTPVAAPSSRRTILRFLGRVPSSHSDQDLSDIPCTCLPYFLTSPSCIPTPAAEDHLSPKYQSPSPPLRLCTWGPQTRTLGRWTFFGQDTSPAE